MSDVWLGKLVRDKRDGDVGRVTADLPDEGYDVLAVFFRDGKWVTHQPNQWAKDNIFELVNEEDAP